MPSKSKGDGKANRPSLSIPTKGSKKSEPNLNDPNLLASIDFNVIPKEQLPLLIAKLTDPVIRKGLQAQMEPSAFKALQQNIALAVDPTSTTYKGNTGKRNSPVKTYVNPETGMQTRVGTSHNARFGKGYDVDFRDTAAKGYEQLPKGQRGSPFTRQLKSAQVQDLLSRVLPDLKPGDKVTANPTTRSRGTLYERTGGQAFASAPDRVGDQVISSTVNRQGTGMTNVKGQPTPLPNRGQMQQPLQQLARSQGRARMGGRIGAVASGVGALNEVVSQAAGRNLLGIPTAPNPLKTGLDRKVDNALAIKQGDSATDIAGKGLLRAGVITGEMTGLPQAAREFNDPAQRARFNQTSAKAQAPFGEAASRVANPQLSGMDRLGAVGDAAKALPGAVLGAINTPVGTFNRAQAAIQQNAAPANQKQQADQMRPFGTEATLKGKKVFWAGEAFGWQTPESFKMVQESVQKSNTNTGGNFLTKGLSDVVQNLGQSMGINKPKRK